MITGREIQSYPRTLFWKKSTDCCSWDGVHCEKTTGQVIELDLHCSQLQGNFHSNGSLFQLFNLKRLDLSFNDFTGSLISPKFGEFSSLMHLDLSRSGFTAICNLKTLVLLNLRSNNLEGTIPQCLGEMSELEVFDLSNNSLSGTIDTTFNIGNQLIIIKLDRNKLQGKVPQFLIYCKKLELLDLSYNELNDTFPKWLGDLPHLQILSLRSNKFYGPIRTNYLFAQIRVINLSSNGFCGDLPVSLFQNFLAMKKIGENSGNREYVADIFSYYYNYSLIVTTKGLDRELPQVLTIQIIIDLSKNRFEGHIPNIIGDLVGFRTLNFSHNVLEGHIPAPLHRLSVLESLDLSSNKLDGEIPQ
uniref:Leucine-rich repeat-containing N-terminal plant-type domain-containing protein n=1 Tax=Solanum lycopersicum TaxID=4081 RepID=A0A3Q7FKB2_SOLLC